MPDEAAKPTKGATPAEPPVHIKTADGQVLGSLCFNQFAKIAGTVAATLLAAILVGAFTFAWASHEKLTRLDDLPKRIDDLEARMVTAIEKNTENIDKNSDRIDALRERRK